MTPDAELRRALRAVAEHPGQDLADDALAHSLAGDLDRAQTADRARRRRLRRAISGAATVVVLGAGVGIVAVHDSRQPPATSPAGVRLVAQELQAPPYTFGLAPAGWSVQGTNPTAVTIAPDDGSTSSDPLDFRGKLIITFDANPLTGRRTTYDGRAIWLTGDSGYVTLSTPTRDGEPRGIVRIQYPGGTGWSERTMLAFLASVRVGPGADHGKG